MSGNQAKPSSQLHPPQRLEHEKRSHGNSQSSNSSRPEPSKADNAIPVSTSYDASQESKIDYTSILMEDKDGSSSN
jgi:hypothetical protein